MLPDQAAQQLGGTVAAAGGVRRGLQGKQVGQGRAVQLIFAGREGNAVAGGFSGKGGGEGKGQRAAGLHHGGKLPAVLDEGAVDGNAQPGGKLPAQIVGAALPVGRGQGVLLAAGAPDRFGGQHRRLHGDEIRLEGDEGADGQFLRFADAQGQHGKAGGGVGEQAGFVGGRVAAGPAADDPPAQQKNGGRRGNGDGKGAEKDGGTGFTVLHRGTSGRWK